MLKRIPLLGDRVAPECVFSYPVWGGCSEVEKWRYCENQLCSSEASCSLEFSGVYADRMYKQREGIFLMLVWLGNWGVNFATGRREKEPVTDGFSFPSCFHSGLLLRGMDQLMMLDPGPETSGCVSKFPPELTVLSKVNFAPRKIYSKASLMMQNQL